MTKAIRHTLISVRELLFTAGPFIVLAVILLALAFWWLDPMPPRSITLATGPEQSGYAFWGQRYADELEKHGIHVELVATQGSAENLRLLQNEEVDLGFVQGGSTETDASDDDLESLGSLFSEPVWLFYRTDTARKFHHDGVLHTLSDLQGLRVNVGSEGSGIPGLMSKLFEANHINPSRMTLSRLRQTPAVAALLDGKLDALVLASTPESLMVQMLLQTPGVALMDFAQSEAYARRFPFLSPVTLPRGVVDLAADAPRHDVHLVATTTTLLALSDVHPALLQLFSQASLKLHSAPGWFNRSHEFPHLANTEHPVAREAERTLKNGVPLLQRYLPFLFANLLERMWLVLGIIVAILLPLSRIVPPVYRLRIRSRVFRWYGQLRQIEDRLLAEGADRDALLSELNTLEKRVGRVKVPLSYADELYALRSSIELVRRKLSDR